MILNKLIFKKTLKGKKVLPQNIVFVVVYLVGGSRESVVGSTSVHTGVVSVHIST